MVLALPDLNAADMRSPRTCCFCSISSCLALMSLWVDSMSACLASMSSWVWSICAETSSIWPMVSESWEDRSETSWPIWSSWA